MLIEAKLSPLLDPNHELNVNRKYTYLYQIIPNEFTNKGIHRTLKYISLVQQKDLEDKRREFWGCLTRESRGGEQTMLGGSPSGLHFQ
jgi:hypothetical protein